MDAAPPSLPNPEPIDPLNTQTVGGRSGKRRRGTVAMGWFAGVLGIPVLAIVALLLWVRTH
jgi:hypothetical protein